jgi:hypothetical protein
MTPSRVFCLAALFLFSAATCFAQSTGSDESAVDDAQTAPRKQYRVEVIAFQYQGPDSAGGEVFDPFYVEDYLPGTGIDMDEYDRVRESVTFTELRVLRNAVERLRSRGQYSVLAAAAWIQPLLSEREAVDVPLGDALWASAGALTASTEGSSSPQLAGTVRIYGGHYLFADVDLKATLPGRAARDGATGESFDQSDDNRTGLDYSRANRDLVPYRISERRRIKLEEVHYFDHPYIGALVSVTRHQ